MPTVNKVGDSTVKNSWDKGTDGLWGWGKPLESYFDSSKLNVENQAASAAPAARGASIKNIGNPCWPG